MPWKMEIYLIRFHFIHHKSESEKPRMEPRHETRSKSKNGNRQKTVYCKYMPYASAIDACHMYESTFDLSGSLCMCVCCNRTQKINLKRQHRRHTANEIKFIYWCWLLFAVFVVVVVVVVDACAGRTIHFCGSFVDVSICSFVVRSFSVHGLFVYAFSFCFEFFLFFFL